MNFVFTIFNQLTGEIDRSIKCPEQMRDIQLVEGESWISGEYDGRKHYVLNGALVAKGDRPSNKYFWNIAAKQWIDPRTVDDHKLEKWKEIKTKRDTLEASGFPYMGKQFDSNPRSVQRISMAVQASQAAMGAGQPFAIEWTAQDNSEVTLDGAGMQGMPVALATYANTLHQYAKTLRDQIEAATTVEEVEAISWTLAA